MNVYSLRGRWKLHIVFHQGNFVGYFPTSLSLQAPCLRHFREFILELQLQQTTAPVLSHFIWGHHVQVTANNISEVFYTPDFLKEIQFKD